MCRGKGPVREVSVLFSGSTARREQIFLSRKGGLNFYFQRSRKGGKNGWEEADGTVRGTAAGMSVTGTVDGAATMRRGSLEGRRTTLSAIYGPAMTTCRTLPVMSICGRRWTMRMMKMTDGGGCQPVFGCFSGSSS
jgi:hypothetical protein